MAEATLIDRAMLAAPATEVAPQLIGSVIVAGRRSGRIVEVEAYMGADDPASHAFRGRTERNSTMFGRAGRLYVYFTYGMHWCANVVTGDEGEANAVLIRALAPLTGIDDMYDVRTRARTDRDLCSGPAKLTQALGIDGTADGVDLCDPASPVQLIDDGWRSTSGELATGSRIGISAATERPWRWYLSGDPNVSRGARRPSSA